MAQIVGDRSAIMQRREMGRQADFLPAGVPQITIPDSEHHIMVDQPLALVAALTHPAGLVAHLRRAVV